MKVIEEYKNIYELIGKLPISANELSKLANETIVEVESALCMLELEGLIKHVPGNKYIKA